MPKPNRTLRAIVKCFWVNMMNRLKDLREDRDMRQKDIALKLNIPTKTYSSYETEERGLSLDILKKIAVFYHTSADYIIGLTNEKKTYKGKK